MVLKRFSNRRATTCLFENDVKMYGTQTALAAGGEREAV